MNAPICPAVLLRQADAERELSLATEGVQRFVWSSRFGDMLIEVSGPDIFVNGSKVMRADPGEGQRPRTADIASLARPKRPT